MPYPIFLQAGYQQSPVFDTSPGRAVARDYTNALWTYLDSLIVGENNGEVLVIGDMALPKASYGGEAYDFLTDLGWTARIAVHNTGLELEDRGLAEVFDEMAAGTYVPRLIYVEDAEAYLGSLFAPLSSDQYLFLRTMAEAGTTALHLHTSLGLESSGPQEVAWVEEFTSGAVKLIWDDEAAVAAAGGYPPWGIGHTAYEEYGAIEYRNVDDKPPLDTLVPPAAEDAMGRLGWGWFVPQAPYDYDAFMARYAIVTPDRDYTNLTGLPGTVRPASSILDFPRPLIITGRRKDVARRFITP